MILGRSRSRYQGLLVLLFSIATAFLASGCLWGVVTDASTGAPLRGVTVGYVDSEGQTGSTTTDANGFYSFDQSRGTVPIAGSVKLTVNAAGYQPMTETRQVEYDDNPSGFWEIQDLSLTPPPNRYHSDKEGLSITFPQGWKITEQPISSIAVGAEAPASEVPGTCDVIVQEVASGTTLTDFVEANLKFIRNYQDYRDDARGQTTVDTLDAVWMVYSSVVTMDGHPITIKDLSYMFVRGARGYWTRCYTVDNQFDGLRDKFEEVLQSFRFD